VRTLKLKIPTLEIEFEIRAAQKNETEERKTRKEEKLKYRSSCHRFNHFDLILRNYYIV